MQYYLGDTFDLDKSNCSDISNLTRDDDKHVDVSQIFYSKSDKVLPPLPPPLPVLSYSCLQKTTKIELLKNDEPIKGLFICNQIL
jgi:hypothetical protein